MKNGGSFHSYVKLPEGKPEMIHGSLWIPLGDDPTCLWVILSTGYPLEAPRTPKKI